MTARRRLDLLRPTSDEGEDQSTRTVVVALATNLGVAVAKSVASVLSRSASMTAEAAHSWADTGNQAFLLIADRRSRRAPDARHPMGYGREAYVWSLLAAVGLFVVGGTLSVWHGVSGIIHGDSTRGDYLLAYVVLAVSFALEGISFLQAMRQLRSDAGRYDRDVLEYALETSDPTVRAVFAEDSGALIGVVIAAGGIALHQLTGNAFWDSLGSILIGVLLGVFAIDLIDRNRRFMTGVPGSSELHDAAVARIEELPEVAAARFVRLEYVGPRQLFLVASVDLVGDPPESHIAHTLRRLERELESNRHIVEAVLTVAEPDEG